MAISQTLSEAGAYDHPITVRFATGNEDLQPGIWIARPQIPEREFSHLTDHLPVILTLSTAVGGGEPPAPPPGPGATLEIVAALPDPTTEERQNEAVHLRNTGGASIALTGWRIGDATGNRFWRSTQTTGATAPSPRVRSKSSYVVAVRWD